MNIYEILKKYWGYTQFRPLQEEIITHILQGKDTLALLPTGGGKSICFQVPALAKPGICVVISPLIALMKDQVQNLKQRGIPAIAVYSGMTYTEADVALDNCIYGDIKFLYVSPERLKTPLFIERFKRMKVNLIAVDESHCISQWGYDFRPPYLEIATIRQYHPQVPVLALTATATHNVIDDIQEKLNFSKKNVLRKSFYRPNLTYAVVQTEDKLQKLEVFLQKIPGTCIVYVRNRKRTKLIAEFLQKKNISATFYHAGLDYETRNARQEGWINNAYRVMVATNAFGMGIDKPDVRLVVHMDLPDNLEAYFQEAGRAGRDEKPAIAITLYNQSDINELLENLQQSFPPVEEIRRCYNALCDYLQLALGSGENETYSVDLGDFSYHFNVNVSTLFHALKFLSKEGILDFTDHEEAYSKVHIHKPEVNYQSIPSEFDKELVRLILRSYEGVFDQFVWINENFLAKKLNCHIIKIVNHLRKLHRLDVLRYAHKKKGFRVTFLTGRIAAGDLKISKENYTERKKIAEKKVHSVIQYVSRQDKCRNRILLEYFDELNHENCRKCDICKKKIHDNTDDFSKIINKLRYLTNDLIYLPQLEEQIPELKKENYKHLRWLSDNGIIKVNPLNMVEINRKLLNKLL
ncbi:MAG: RecQ family ATP-dependent DNA helicase [Flavobacteriales bacterium]|nr:RecQ family ATP-dependent DNA helicase [Flavobacteriales bacterium]